MVQPHLENSGLPYLKRNIVELENVQREAKMMIRDFSYKERLENLGFFSLEKDGQREVR